MVIRPVPVAPPNVKVPLVKAFPIAKEPPVCVFAIVITFAAVPPMAIVLTPVPPVPRFRARAFVPVPRLNTWVPPEAFPENTLIVCVPADGAPPRIVRVSFWAESPPQTVTVLAAAGAMFAISKVVSLVLSPKSSDATPTVPIPERIETVELAADAPFAILTV